MILRLVTALLFLLAAHKACADTGKDIYLEHCADCHGDLGEGVEDEYELPLTGDDPVAMLSAVIHRTMPEEKPKAVAHGDADAVAAYMYDAFYSPEAWQRVHPAQVVPTRLTVHQFETAIADLVGAPWPKGERGLRKTAGRLSGSVIADRTGDYEFILRTEQPFQLWVNDLEVALLEGSQPLDRKTRSRHARIRLLAGRAYPIALESEEPLKLLWQPPGGKETPLPMRNTCSEMVPATPPMPHSLPPDRRLGYWRGQEISRGYLGGVSQAADALALHFANDWQKNPDAFKQAFAKRSLGRALRDDEALLAPGKLMRQILSSPDFLYAQSPSLAHRLAHILWDSLPNSTLPADIAPEALARQMLRSPQTRVKLRLFFDDWLDLPVPAEIAKDETLFPEFDAVMAADLRASLDNFLEQLIWEGDADYRQLFLAEDAPHHAGLVTHPYVLSALAFPENTSPIDRGVFLTRKILGRPLKSPHKDIAVLGQVVALADFAADLTMRDKIAELTKSEDCQTCHDVINPLGFSLEHFDAIGRYRSHDRDSLIKNDGAFEGAPVNSARDVARIAAYDETAQRAFVVRLFEYFSKQSILAYGSETEDELYAEFVASGFNIRELILASALRAAQFHPTP